MTLYEEVYYSTPNLSKFYRFEGYRSFPYFQVKCNEHLITVLNYIYFSGTEKHHMYYIARRLRHLISKEILKDTGLNFDKKTLLDSASFNEIEKSIENYPITSKLLSIEFSLSPIIKELLQKNFIINTRKQMHDRRIERVDRNVYSGGYGFCEEWLEAFDVLTFFHAY